MREQKVYVDRDLLSSFYTRSGTDLGKRKWVQAEIVFYNVNNIYLYDIKTHDRELVKEVCEDLTKSILNLKYVNDTREFATYVLSIIKSKQKDFEK